MKRLAAYASLLALGSCGSLPAQGSPGPDADGSMNAPGSGMAERRGAAYAQANCSGCHAIGPTGDSPMAEAPHFRALGLRYPVADLAEAFAEGIVTAHPAMPEFVMSTSENSDLVAYLQSIQTRHDP